MVRRLIDALSSLRTPARQQNEEKESEDALVLVFVPPLVTILAAAEKSKGGALSEDECISIRDKSICMTVRLSVAQEMAKGRGYEDIVVEDVRNEWQIVRQTLQQ